MKDANRQKISPASSTALALLLFCCVFMPLPVSGGAPLPQDHYTVSAAIGSSARIPDILRGLGGVGCSVKGTTVSSNAILGETKETVLFKCLVKRRAVKAVIKKFRGYKSIKDVKVVENLVGARAEKLKEKLSPFFEEYESNRELFKTLPIANALMLEKIAPLDRKGSVRPVKVSGSAMLEFLLVKRYPKGSAVPEDVRELRDRILREETDRADDEEADGIE